MIVGILFLFCGPARTGASHQLAQELFEENNWSAALREAERVLLDHEEPEARFITAVSRLRLGIDVGSAESTLRTLTEQTANAELRAQAAYECGRYAWLAGRHAESFLLFRVAFTETRDTDLFLHSACSLFLLMEEDRSLASGNAPLVMQIDTTRALWYGRLFAECRIHPRRPIGIRPLLKFPGRLVVLVYRNLVGPALGQRCSLVPSCSRYFAAASEKYGMLAFPIVADRFFREPGVVQSGEHPLRHGDSVFYADPLADHDFWFAHPKSTSAQRPAQRSGGF